MYIHTFIHVFLYINLETGCLYTWGWNKYGQLGHGDTCSRDKPACVKYFTANHLTVSHVYSGYWTTVVCVEPPATS